MSSFTYAVVDAGDEPCRIAAAIAAVVFGVVLIPLIPNVLVLSTVA